MRHAFLQSESTESSLEKDLSAMLAFFMQGSIITSGGTCTIERSFCSCGAMTHKTKDCVERPRKTGAKWTKTEIAPDEKIQELQLETFDAKKDRWNGYDTAEYARVIDM